MTGEYGSSSGRVVFDGEVVVEDIPDDAQESGAVEAILTVG